MSCFTLGIPEPEDKDEKPMTSTEMRAAIMKESRNSPLIRNCTIQADVIGLNGEDRYVLLAYRALRALETYYQQVARWHDLAPVPLMNSLTEKESSNG